MLSPAHDAVLLDAQDIDKACKIDRHEGALGDCGGTANRSVWNGR